MLTRTSLIALTLATLAGAAAGCCCKKSESAGVTRNTMSLAQGDAVGRALLAPSPAPAIEVTSTQAEAAPAD